MAIVSFYYGSDPEAEVWMDERGTVFDHEVDLADWIMVETFLKGDDLFPDLHLKAIKVRDDASRT